MITPNEDEDVDDVELFIQNLLKSFLNLVRSKHMSEEVVDKIISKIQSKPSILDQARPGYLAFREAVKKRSIERFIRDLFRIQPIPLNADDRDKIKQYTMEQEEHLKALARLCLAEADEMETKVIYDEKNPLKIMKRLTATLSEAATLPYVLEEASLLLKAITQSKGVVLYIVDNILNEIYQHPRMVDNPPEKVNWDIGCGTIIAAHVAQMKEPILVEDALADVRFPEGVGWKALLVKAVLCVPVMTSDTDCIAVIELYKDMYAEQGFTENDKQIVMTINTWMGAAIRQNEERLALEKQLEVHDQLLEVIELFFSDINSKDKTISDIMILAKKVIGADRSSLHILGSASDDLVAEVFNEGLDSLKEGILRKKKFKVRFNDQKGIAGHVARTGEALNVRDAYNDPMFNREIDKLTGYITHTVMCMPILGKHGVLGVVQLINKKTSAYFTMSDERTFKLFASYFTLLVNYAKLQENAKQQELLNTVKRDLLAYHMHPSKNEIDTLLHSLDSIEYPEGFDTFSWYPIDCEDMMPQLTVCMLHDICQENIGGIEAICEFVLTIKHSYRSNYYHNFEHAFNCCHCMYNILKRNMDIFTPFEAQALMIAALGHDSDHRGFSNNFLHLTNNTLALLYPESTLEHHHVYMTMLIVQSCKIFPNLTGQEYKEFTQQIHDAIIATDVVVYFHIKQKLDALLKEGVFDYENDSHRELLKSLIMSTCDISGQCKPCPVAKTISDTLYKEYYNQGDLERKLGICPIPMMDREKSEWVADYEVNFLSVFCLPCTQTLKTILPNTTPLFILCQELDNHWKKTIEMRGQEVWIPEESITE